MHRELLDVVEDEAADVADVFVAVPPIPSDTKRQSIGLEDINRPPSVSIR